jgi:hypothetical protein
MLDSIHHPGFLDYRFHGNDNGGAGMTGGIMQTILDYFRDVIVTDEGPEAKSPTGGLFPRLPPSP